MNPQASTNIRSLIINILSNSSFDLLSRSRKRFVKNALIAFLSIKGRINFLQLGRFGAYCESTNRVNFEENFNFLEFNKILISEVAENVIIGFDPSYLSKSGKETPGVGYFWSGVANQTKWGLEICGFAAIDSKRNTAFHLKAFQTPCSEELDLLKMTQLSFYASLITQEAAELKKLSQYIVADAYFSKLPFVKAVSQAKMFFITRLRSDSNLRYIYNGSTTGKRGRTKKYDGKIDYKNLDMNHFKLELQNEEMKVYGAIVNSVAFKKDIKVAVVEYLKDGKIAHRKIYCSTNMKQETLEILTHYQARFQMEFVFRDAKQFTGLNTCEARSKNKIDFHINTSLTTVNLAKADWFSEITNIGKPFSMADYKTHFNNELMIDLFMCKFGIKPNRPKNKRIKQELLDYGKIAA